MLLVDNGGHTDAHAPYEQALSERLPSGCATVAGSPFLIAALVFTTESRMCERA